MEDFIFISNDKIDSGIKHKLGKLRDNLGANNIFAMISSSSDKNMIYCNKSECHEDEKYCSILQECCANTMKMFDDTFSKVHGTGLEDLYEVERSKFYILPIVHYQQGDSVQSALLGMLFNNRFDLRVIESNFQQIQAILDELTTKIELLFLKSDNYSRMYKLLDVFEELSSQKSTRLPYHMNNVASWSLEIAREMQLHEIDMLNLYFAALAHDIGFIYADPHIMNKRDALTNEEYSQIKAHSEKGEQLFQLCVLGIPTLAEIPGYIRHHHERWDGNGYPDRLIGDKIPLLSQIIAVADAVDSMLSERLFSTPKSISEVKEELVKCAGIQFSPQIVEIMLNILDRNSIHVDHNFVFNDIMVIHNVAVRVKFYDSGDIVNYQGNLMINGKQARITLNDCDSLDMKNIHSIKMAFFDRKKIYEFHINPSEIIKNTIFINEMSQIPGDRLFSLYWDIDVEMKLPTGSTLMKSLRVGGEGLAFLLNHKGKDAEIKDDMVKMIGKPITLVLHFILEEEISDIGIEAVITGYYISGERIIFLLKYVNPPHEVVDRIVRLLFRRQMQSRRFHKQQAKGK